MLPFRFLLALLLAGLLQQAGAQEFAAIPPLSAHVIDQAQLLDEQQRHTLDQVLQEYETRSGSQIAVLLVSSTAPEAIEQYGIRVADAWKLGRKGVDDGVILIVAKDNSKALRRLRIEAGRGVQGSLTDAKSKRILEDVIAPHFRQNDYYGGLAAGISALTSLLDEAQLPAAPSQPAAAHTDNSQSNLVPILILLFLAVSGLVLGRKYPRNNLNKNSWGNSTSGVILGSILSELTHSGGSGGGGGRSGSGGGSSGSSFSGGGGGFDGGGASGDW